MKGIVRNEYREAWRAGEIEGIPQNVLNILQEDYASEKASKEASAKESSASKKNSKEVKAE